MANLLAQCFDIFPLYGREPDAVANIRAGFMVVLGEFPIEKVEQAFRYHLQNFREFPVPADIAHIVLRGNKPPFERSLYISISRKAGEDRTREEWDYLKDYERYILTGRY